MENGACNFIGGGRNNVVAGAYSAILGGSGNTVAAAYAGIFGNGVVAVASNAFHSNNFVAQNIPLASLGTPAGLNPVTFWADDLTTPGICCVLIV